MLPLAIIIVLLVSAVIIAVVKNNAFAKAMTLCAFGMAFGLSVIQLFIIMSGKGPVNLVASGSFGGIVPSIGPLEAFMSCLFTGIGLLIMWASVSMIDHDVEEKKIPLYYFLICTLIAMLCGVVFYDNLFYVFIFIEFSSFAAACIVIIKNQPENLKAGLKYLVLSILGSGSALMGIVILYSLSGSLAMHDIHEALLVNVNDRSVLNAFAFITVGIGFKSALFPMHIWLPDAHGTAPSPSSAVLSSLVLKAFIVFYIKTLYVMVGHEIIAESANLSMLLSVVLVFGVVAMLAGSIFAILQTDIKRMIAYSSVAQIGYIFMGIGLGNRLGLYAAVYHILAHAVTKAGLFLVAGSIIEQTHNRRLDKMGGVGYQMPVTMAFFTIGALSMVGIPMFVGFNSKWNFAMGIMGSGKFWVMAVLAISSLLNALYYLPVVIRAFFGPQAREKAENRVSVERPVSALVPIGVLSCLVILAGLFSNWFVTLIDAAIGSIW